MVVAILHSAYGAIYISTPTVTINIRLLFNLELISYILQKIPIAQKKIFLNFHISFEY